MREFRRITRSDLLNVAVLLLTGVAVGVATVAASALAERRDRLDHRFWRVLDEDLPDEYSAAELAMLAGDPEVAQ